MIETHIQGIPCKIEMTSGFYLTPSHNFNAPSDIDFYGGWQDVQFEVYDRRGYRAKWLEKKMTSNDVCRIIDLLIDNT